MTLLFERIFRRHWIYDDKDYRTLDGTHVHQSRHYSMYGEWESLTCEEYKQGLEHQLARKRQLQKEREECELGK